GITWGFNTDPASIEWNRIAEFRADPRMGAYGYVARYVSGTPRLVCRGDGCAASAAPSGSASAPTASCTTTAAKASSAATMPPTSGSSPAGWPSASSGSGQPGAPGVVVDVHTVLWRRPL